MSFEMQHLFNKSSANLEQKIEKLIKVISGIVEIFTNTTDIIDEQMQKVQNELDKLSVKVDTIEKELKNEFNEKLSDLEKRVKAAFEAGEKEGILNTTFKSNNNFESKKYEHNQKSQDNAIKKESLASNSTNHLSSRAQLQSELKELFKRMKHE